MSTAIAQDKEPAAAATALLDIQGVRKRFGNIQALDGVDLSIGRGEVVCIIGPSGCGKSTLLRCINFLVEPDEGSVRLEGRYVGRVPHRGRFRRDRERSINMMRARMAMVFQSFNLWPHLTVIENVARAPIVVLKRERDEVERRACALLVQVGLADKRDSYPAHLSGGQQQRVAIARALAMEPDVLLFDEPTSALDPELIGEVLGVMRGLAEQGRTMLVVTHELKFASQAADRIVFMDGGKVVEAGPPDALLRNPCSARLRGFLSMVGSGGQP